MDRTDPSSPARKGQCQVDIHADDDIHFDENAFMLSCENGHLTVAKWLLGLGTSCSHPTCPSGTRYSLGDIDIHSNDDHAFCISCEKGHLTVAQWLYSLGDIDIHVDNEYAFKSCCENGHLIVAKWLYSLGDVDIHADNEYAFRWSCKK